MKQNVITDVIQGMLPYLNNAQTERLQEVLQHTLFDYEVTKTEKDKELSEQNLVESFLSAKRIEGCSEKTLKYYNATIQSMLAVSYTHLTFFIIRNHIDSVKQNEVYDNLAEIVEDEPPKENEGVTFSEDKDYFAEYLELYRQNEDMVGWIKVEDTNINYPVVQSVNEPNFYLKHKFDKTYSAYGCPYVQENCDVQKPSDNIIIYGHHMNDGSMFTGLMKYRNKSFWEGHKTITFDTLTDRHQYEVIAVFKTVVYTNSSDSFKYYEFTDAENVAEFDAYVAKCKELSLYDTGVSAEYCLLYTSPWGIGKYHLAELGTA